jgi:valyl-tRNA synthetase
MEAIGRMARASAFEALVGEVPAGSAQAVVGEATVVIPLAGVIDLGAERARLAKERAKVADEAQKIAKKLGNADFVARAKEEVVEENRERLAAAEAEIARLDSALRRIA